jgi:hypothetical protein
MSGELKPSEVLARAADLIEPEGKWTQGAYGKTHTGKRVENLRWAVCFCAVGAIAKVARRRPGRVHDSLFPPVRYVERANDIESLGFWNDVAWRTQAEVVAALRKASQLAKEAGE